MAKLSPAGRCTDREDACRPRGVGDNAAAGVGRPLRARRRSPRGVARAWEDWPVAGVAGQRRAERERTGPSAEAEQEQRNADKVDDPIAVAKNATRILWSAREPQTRRDAESGGQCRHADEIDRRDQHGDDARGQKPRAASDARPDDLSRGCADLLLSWLNDSDRGSGRLAVGWRRAVCRATRTLLLVPVAVSIRSAARMGHAASEHFDDLDARRQGVGRSAALRRPGRRRFRRTRRPGVPITSSNHALKTATAGGPEDQTC